MENFYVYVHRRKDSGIPFYVGKGSGPRAHVPQGRNRYWKAVAAKHGYDVEFAVDQVDEEFAHLAEMELIHKLRAVGVALTNLTDGGEGMHGFSMSPESIQRRAESQRGQKRPTVSAKLKGRPKSVEHRAALSLSKAGFTHTEAAKAKMSATRKGRPSSMLGKKHTEESKRKISAGITGEKNPFYGKRHPQEILDRIRKANTGQVRSDEVRQRMSISRSGERNHLFGKPVPQDRKDKQAATLRARQRITCIHCQKAANEGNIKRWHMDNCRERK